MALFNINNLGNIFKFTIFNIVLLIALILILLLVYRQNKSIDLFDNPTTTEAPTTTLAPTTTMNSRPTEFIPNYRGSIADFINALKERNDQKNKYQATLQTQYTKIKDLSDKVLRIINESTN